MEIRLVERKTELQSVARVLVQLRPEFSEKDLIQQMSNQLTTSYELAVVWEDAKPVSVAGFLIAEKLAWKKHMYIDELITDQAHRSMGYGKLLLEWLKNYARERGCVQLHLDSGVQRFAAHKFYLENGFRIASHHFAMSL